MFVFKVEMFQFQPVQPSVDCAIFYIWTTVKISNQFHYIVNNPGL